jgi:hypothetical protein
MIVQILAASACILWVLAVPLSKTPLGGTLRRWGCFAFLLAFAPSLFYGILHESRFFTGAWSARRIGEEALTLLIVAVIAYGVLRVRKRLSAEKQPGKRVMAKQPVDPPSRRPDLINMLREQLRDGPAEHDRGE